MKHLSRADAEKLAGVLREKGYKVELDYQSSGTTYRPWNWYVLVEGFL